MKKFILFFALMLNFVQSGSVTHAQRLNQCLDVDQLIEVATRHIQIQVNAGNMPAWTDTHASQPMAFYNLQGEITAFTLPVVTSQEDTVGYLVIQPSTCLVIEFAEALPPYMYGIKQAEAIASQWDMAIDYSHPIYLTPLDQYFRLRPGTYIQENLDSVLLNMEDFNYVVLDKNHLPVKQLPGGQSLPVPVLDRSLLPSPVTPNVMQQDAVMTSTAKELSTPDYLQFQHNGCWVGCTPVAGATLVGYWADHGFPNLMSSGWQQSVIDLHDSARTDCVGENGFTDFNNLAGALNTFTTNHGYPGFASETVPSQNVTYDILRGEIDHDRPLVVHFAWDGGYITDLNGHSNTGVGYKTAGGNYITIKSNLRPPNYSYQRDILFIGAGPYPGSMMFTTLVPPDNQPPVTTQSLSGMVGNNDWYVVSPQVTLTSQDNPNGRGVNYIRYRDNGGNWITYTSPFSLPDGLHTVEYQAVDMSGNWETVKTFSTKVDTAAPSNPGSVNSGCGAASNIWQSTCSAPSFTWSGASDNASGLAGYEYIWGANAAAWTTGTTYRPSTVGEGTTILQIRVKDNAGNWSNWANSFVFRYDTTAPTGSLLINNNATSTYATLVKLYTSAEDSSSGVSQYQIRENNGSWSGKQPYINFLYWLFPPVNGQMNTINIQYFDRAGNSSPIYTKSVTLNIYPARPESQSFILAKSTFGFAAVNASSANYQMKATAGQSSMIGAIRSNNYGLWSGFWSTRYHLHSSFLPFIKK